MDQKVFIIGGHYGSGKTEVSLNLALENRAERTKVALIDLDIANPYFRSREKTEEFSKYGIDIFGNFFRDEVTLEIPALAANVRTPLEDPETVSIVDLGGDGSGAKVLVQFMRAIENRDFEFYCVINRNRPETDSPEKAIAMISEIEAAAGLKISGLVNNSHFLTETSADDIVAGVVFCREIEKRNGIPLRMNCCPERLTDDFSAKLSGADRSVPVLPIRMIMRDAWLDQTLTL